MVTTLGSIGRRGDGQAGIQTPTEGKKGKSKGEGIPHLLYLHTQTAILTAAAAAVAAAAAAAAAATRGLAGMASTTTTYPATNRQLERYQMKICTYNHNNAGQSRA
jgi:hypothetical protein